MLAIFKRDFKSLFQNVIGFLFVGLMLSVFGLYFTVYNLRGASSSITTTLLGVIHVSLFSIPLLTMRSLSEERKNKTDQLLLTAPVSVFKIVFGKFMALAAVFSIVVGVICLTPLLLSLFGTVNFVENYIAILGFWLFGLLCISVGMLVSSFFESQILSAVVSLIFIFLGYIMNGLITTLNATGITQKILKCYDFVTPLSNFMNGNFQLADLIYDLSIIALMIFLTCQGILKRRWSVSSKNRGMTILSTSGVAIGIVLCIVINILSSYIPKKYSTIDFTSQKLYTLTSESKEYLKSLEDEIQIYVAGKESALDDVENKTLSNFADTSKHISVEYVDIDSDMKFFQKYTDDTVSVGDVAVVHNKVSKMIRYSELYQYSVDYATYYQSVSGYDGEGQLISAIQYVTRDNFTTIYQLEGHDEITLGTEFTDVIKKANWELESLNLLSAKAVPEDCAVLIINAPQSDFSEDDCEKVLSFIKNGGDVIMTFDVLCKDELKNYKSLLDDYEVSLKDGMVFDNDMDFYYQYPNVLLPNVESSDAAPSVYGNLQVIVPYSYAFNMPIFNESYKTLLSSSYKASLDEDVDVENLESKMQDALKESEEKAAEEEEDSIGYFYTLAVQMELDNDSHVILYGSPYMFVNQFNELVSGRNATLLLDNLKYMIGETEEDQTVVIPVKSLEQGYLTVPQSALLLFGLLFGIVIPVILIIIGIIYWVIRRRR